MDNSDAIETFAALAQPTRLDAFRLLVRCAPEGLPAGEIARRLDAPHNTLSTHLAILSRAGLIASERRSRQIVYRARLEAVREIAGFLLKECCDGRPDVCAPLLEDLAAGCGAARSGSA